MNSSPQGMFRLTTMVFAAILGIQSVWILLTEFSRPHIDRLPADAGSAAAAAKQRTAATWAASLGFIRGDLWANAAFTYSDALWGEAETAGSPGQAIAPALTDLDHALGLAPVHSSAWLLLAGLSSRYPSAGVDTIKALKMSYYTGPSEQDLIPLRLRIVAQSDFVGDFELRQFVTRDVRLLLSEHQKSAIVAAYNAASPSGKPFIEQAVREIDPTAATWLRQPLPD